MKRLLFVPSVAIIGIVAGCSTPLKDSHGNPVHNTSGEVITVSSSTQEQVEKSSRATTSAIIGKLAAAAKTAKTSEVASFSLSDEEIRRLAGPGATPEVIAALKALAAAEADKYRKNVIYPARVAAAKVRVANTIEKFIANKDLKKASDYLTRVKSNGTGVREVDDPINAFADELNNTRVVQAYADEIIGKTKPVVKKSVADGDFGSAREALWNSFATGNAEVDALVRPFAVEQMHVVVNPADWTAQEKTLTGKVAQFEKARKYDEGIAWLKAYPRVRTYSVKLEDSLKKVEAEVVKLGVKKESTKPILEATGKLVADAEKILDMTDVTTNTVTEIAGKEIAGFDPNLEAYKARLEVYRKTLLRYDCVESAADSIAKKVDAEMKPLLDALSKPASKEEGSVETKKFLQLGTGGLNARIDKLVAKLIADLEAKKKSYVAAQREAEIKSAIDDLTAKVKKLVAEGKYAEARETIWAATSTDDVEKNAKVREVGTELMLKLVNPTHWNAIEKEFADKAAEAKKNANYDEVIAWVEAYPDIRTYTVVIDERLDGVKEELAKIGVAVENIDPVVAETQKVTVEAARLASHVDKVTKSVVKGEKDLPLAEYEKLLANYRKALILNDCTQENADKLVANFKAKMAHYLELLAGGSEKTDVVLGSNAINDRLVKLRAQHIDMLKSQKYRYVFTDLISRVSEAVAEKRYSDARNVIRDVKLVEDAEWDARIYSTRIGLLNSIVNPNQCIALLAEIDAKAKELFDAQKYEEFREWAENYEYVHDTYAQIAAALEQIKAAMVGLTIAEQDAGAYIDALSLRIREMMEKRPGTYEVESDKDLSELEKALDALEKSIVEQYYRPDEVKKFCDIVKKEILALITKTPDPMTTWEMNEALRIRLAKYLEGLDALIAKRDAANAANAYAKLLADIDAEVSFDSQIAMAEDAIAKQLGIKCPSAHLKMNALLGEYARTMRLLKLGKKIDKTQATVVLLGGVYLDQTAVVTRAIELGADVNGTSERDPLARTGVLMAIQVGHNSFLKQLADAGAALDPSDTNGDTALHYAVRRGNLAVVKAMLAPNDVNKANKAGESALFVAVRRNQAPVAAALTAAKADANAKNAKGVSVMDAACLAGSRDVLDVLADAGAEYGPAQLKIAAEKDRLAVAQWLIGKGVDVNAKGVMEATVCKSDTQRYLVHEGGILKDCEKKCCKTADEKPAAPAPAAAAPAKLAEATGTINFKVSEVK